MATKDICTVDQLDNSTDITNIIIDESGNLRKVNLKKAVNNFAPKKKLNRYSRIRMILRG